MYKHNKGLFDAHLVTISDHFFSYRNISNSYLSIDILITVDGLLNYLPPTYFQFTKYIKVMFLFVAWMQYYS